MSLSPPDVAPLDTTEAEHLADCETIIAAGLASFVEVGEALADVRDRRLYRQTHGTFEDYCVERWGLSRNRAYRLIEGAEVAAVLPIGNTLPANEAQARPLAPLRDDPEALASAWQAANEAAEAKGKAVTAADVTAAVKAQQPEPNPTDEPVSPMEAAKRKDTEEDVLKKLSRAAVEARVAKACEMAADGYTSRQIAEAIGIAPDSFTHFRKRHGVVVPADAIVGKTHRHDSDRMVSESVATLEGVAMTLDLVGHPADAGIDPAKLDGWVTSLTASLKFLTTFSKQLKEMTQ